MLRAEIGLQAIVTFDAEWHLNLGRAAPRWEISNQISIFTGPDGESLGRLENLDQLRGQLVFKSVIAEGQ